MRMALIVFGHRAHFSGAKNCRRKDFLTTTNRRSPSKIKGGFFRSYRRRQFCNLWKVVMVTESPKPLGIKTANVCNFIRPSESRKPQTVWGSLT